MRGGFEAVLIWWVVGVGLGDGLFFQTGDFLARAWGKRFQRAVRFFCFAWRACACLGRDAYG